MAGWATSKKELWLSWVVLEWDPESLAALFETLGVLDLSSSCNASCRVDAWTRTWLTTEPYLHLLIQK